MTDTPAPAITREQIEKLKGLLASRVALPVQIVECADYAEIIDAHGSKLALTVQPELFTTTVNVAPALLARITELEAIIAGEPERAREVVERCAKVVDSHVMLPAGGPFSHTNSMRVVLIDAAKAIRTQETGQ